MENKKSNSYEKYKTISIYLPKEVREQLQFICTYKNITRSGLCCKLVKWFLKKKDVEQLMRDYALEKVKSERKKQK